MLSRGRGTDKPDWNEGLKWIRRAAQSGHEDAQFSLGEHMIHVAADSPETLTKQLYGTDELIRMVVVICRRVSICDAS